MTCTARGLGAWYILFFGCFYFIIFYFISYFIFLFLWIIAYVLVARCIMHELRLCSAFFFPVLYFLPRSLLHSYLTDSMICSLLSY
ncbi:hypothetical protein BDV23DRAFT_36945 [Aspergillus alliaceus]|uniref:Uncharacterized protein n=1 Tax=Petromyces alliaceus TaxID=209559 RepID=A0A5N7CIB5_PETAA|nr:hypothetical protein BDV23DRAFT_36945 [Aspergillus alliaceus]